MPTVINETEILNQKALAMKDELSVIKNKMEEVSFVLKESSRD